ncbi:MAG: carbohydrate ABC transporter permease [Clostridiaceae bacterium]|nr:carbohydrate ABC transporter permease [Clostridiales bacterium]MDD2441413.1 carbohydrate ABC transporter permease [Eubacteriales bacterium]MDD4139948.1 carbohydrate ABC transporter permease [Eubacteriales bacterium]MDD4744010.1 carbohydrate ABC transporter permease [Eubacteriales bacterium]NLB43696.1 carbohydrate ABC transporter permease [Clostridiaceae bacterium]
MRRTRGEQVFNVFNIFLLGLLGFTCLMPFVHIIAKSLSSEIFVLAKEVVFLPKGFTLNAYYFIVINNQFQRSFTLTVSITVIGTAVALLTTSMTAFVLTRKDLPGGLFIALLYIFTMFFGGGMIATYILYKQIGLIDNYWVLIFPACINPFNIVLMRNFFESISPSLEESAKIDGASHFRILFKIILPLSKAALATIGLFFAVTYWNSFVGALLYTTKRELMTMQLYLRNMLTAIDNLMDTNSEMLDTLATETVRAATIIAAMVPILMVYPFVQKYFVKGIMIGAIKE